MRATGWTPFAAVLRAELLFNLKRVAPYALAVIFSANAVLWWAGGPAVSRGWAVNSDFYIVWLFGGFSFMMLPLFIPLIMGDPVIRDFRVGIDPLIFSKPVRRGEYLLGKFCGNFFVLVCCQAFFVLTSLLLQAFSTQGMIVLPPRVLPYFQHFFFFVVVSSLALGAVCFTVGTLTRNVKIVYGLAVSFYFLFVAWQYAIKNLPPRWRIILDPLLFNVGAETFKGRGADWLNQTAISYDADMIINRLLMVAVSLVCLGILYLRFSSTERDAPNAWHGQTSIFGLSSATDKLEGEAESITRLPAAQSIEAIAARDVALPRVNTVTSGLRSGFEQFWAALGIEFRLLRAERSLVVVAPLMLFLCALELAAFDAVAEVSYSAAYAGRTANALLLFLSGVAVFYTGETMHRDRELRIEPVIWSAPVPNFVLLFSKFAATLLLAIVLMVLVALAAIGVQIYKGHAPLDVSGYLMTYAVILLPGVIFMIAASVGLNILLRDKYLTYAVSLALGGSFFYLAGQGYNHWLFNPVLYRLWTPADLTMGGGQLTRILVHRIYTLALSALLMALALLFFGRKSTKGLSAHGRLSGAGWSILAAIVSAAIAAGTGLIIVQSLPIR